MHVIRKMLMSITVTIAVDESDVITICEGGGAEFDCVLKTNNISSDDVQWYRFIKSRGITEMIDPNGTNITFTTKHSANDLTTNLNITNAVTSYTGYYWVRSPSDDMGTCNTSVTIGKSM